MDLSSAGPAPVASLVWQVRPSTWVLTVVCKATFTLAPGELTLAPIQEPIRELDAHWDDDPSRSLRAPSDLAPLKQGADVVLVGHAFAPTGTLARSLVARLVVGDVDKSIQVTSHRAFSPRGELQEGPRFVKMSLAYEHAAGGAETANPVGVARDARDAQGNLPLPSLIPAGHIVQTPGEAIGVVGFGPITASWPARRKLLGAHAATWTPSSLKTTPLPADLDRAFFSAAPVDQRLEELRDDEQLALENLHPKHPRLIAMLPGIRPRAVATGRASGPREVPMRADTLVIDNDRLLCTVTWRGQLPLAQADETGQVQIHLERPGGGAATAPSEPVTAIKKAVAPGDRTVTIDPDARLADVSLTGKASLPFRPGASSPPAPLSSRRDGPPSGATTDLTDPGPPMTTPFRTPVAPAPPYVQPLPPGPAPTAIEPQSPWAAGAPVEGRPAFAAMPEPIALRLEPALAPVPTAPPPVIAQAAPPRESTVLVWMDRKSVARVARKPAWRTLLDELEDEARDPEDDDPALADEPSVLEERALLLTILERGTPLGGMALEEALSPAKGKRSRVAPPLALVDGVLTFPFDEVETLKAWVSSATPLADGDEPLAQALTIAERFLATSATASAPSVAEGLTARIREVLLQGKHKKTADALAYKVERALLEQRHYQRRKVLGAPHLRGTLSIDAQPFVLYVPIAVADALPLASQFRARAIAALHPRVDDAEGPLALEALALARLVRLDSL